MKMAKFIMAAAVMASAQASTCGTPSGGSVDSQGACCSRLRFALFTAITIPFQAFRPVFMCFN